MMGLMMRNAWDSILLYTLFWSYVKLFVLDFEQGTFRKKYLVRSGYFEEFYKKNNSWRTL
jgi:hypothetical protein